MKRTWNRVSKFLGLTLLILAIAGVALAQHRAGIMAEKLALTGIEVEGAQLTASFEGRRLAYSVVVPNEKAEVNLKVAAADASAQVAINNAPAADGAVKKVALSPGSNMVRIQVSSPDGRYTRTYVLNATRLY